MKALLDKKYYSIYLVTAIIAACFIFMIVSTIAVLGNIGGGKTSADLALKSAQKACEKQKGELVQLSDKNPLYTRCVVSSDDKPAKDQ